MTRFEMIAQQMANTDTVYFAMICSYWMRRHGSCDRCPIRYKCDCDPMPTDEEMEAWLKEEV